MTEVSMILVEERKQLKGLRRTIKQLLNCLDTWISSVDQMISETESANRRSKITAKKLKRGT